MQVIIIYSIYYSSIVVLCIIVVIFPSFISDLLVWIYWIRVHWYWNLSSGVLENCLWGVSKPYVQICFSHRFVEGCGKGPGWEFRLVCFNLSFCLIWNILWFICLSLILFIVDLCISYLLDQSSLIIKLVLGCVQKLSLGRIQTGHMDLIPPQVCGRYWWGFRFLLFHLSSSMHWLASRQFLRFVVSGFKSIV